MRPRDQFPRPQTEQSTSSAATGAHLDHQVCVARLCCVARSLGVPGCWGWGVRSDGSG